MTSTDKQPEPNFFLCLINNCVTILRMYVVVMLLILLHTVLLYTTVH